MFGESEWNRRRDDGRIEKLSNNNTLKESAENWSDRNGSIIRFLCEGGKKGRLKSITSWACKLYFFELCTLGYSAGLICYKCKKLQFIHKLTASDTSKTAKITKR